MPSTPIYVSRTDADGVAGVFSMNSYVALALVISSTIAATLWSLTALVYWFVFMAEVIF